MKTKKGKKALVRNAFIQEEEEEGGIISEKPPPVTFGTERIENNDEDI
jgi:hypothetical protein